ncbi:hypothetical protein PHYPSEUDO_014055 [Phytophthora pseudosyringae]|uniref:BRCT domain-containing protein n=1 Tax=Phytophthora pseudosyringae TaxID=221518 RepID=A0A8T1V7F2_9STRA|nr:hypothetical protein PHYPSEUDO_014055 [Phytophthora pseudosyringae]
MAVLLFRELRFYVAATLSAEDRAELVRLIEQNGGVVSDSPEGVTQLVDYEKLDARLPQRISADFIQDSVALRALQDPARYSGEVFATAQERKGYKRRGRIPYTLEDDARMLHFARTRDWKSMSSVPASAWRLAASERVTLHPALSMHEHFRKQLQRKTAIEQRDIVARAARMVRARLLEQDAEAEEEEEQEVAIVEPPRRARTKPDSTGFRDAPTSTSTAVTQSWASRRTSSSAGRQSTIEGRLKEVEEEKFSATRTRSRKPTSPLRISQRVLGSEETESSSSTTSHSADESITSPPPTSAPETSSVTPTQATPAVTATFVTPNIPVVHSTSAASASSATPSTPGDQSTGKKQQTRKRATASNGATIDRESSPSHQDSDTESAGSKTGGGDNGVFFRSVWTEVARDQSKRRLLQKFFGPPSVPAPQPSSTDSVVSEQTDRDVFAVVQERDDSSEDRGEAQATDEDTDDIICHLQIDTHQGLPSVVHALYYCSGDVEVARAFLKGAAPSEMWSPEDDLLLVHLVAEEGTDRSTVDGAVARGDFASMQVTRDTDAILKRVQFLR